MVEACTTAVSEASKLIIGSSGYPDGYSNEVELDPGTYFVRETKVPTHGLLKIDKTCHPAEVESSKTVIVTSVEELNKKTIDIKISKMEVAKSSEIPGAKIKITTKEGKMVESWTSGNEPHEFSLEAGDYILTEEVAPKGYNKLETNITFRVDTEGNVTILGAKSNSAKIVKSSDGDLDHLIIYNEPSKIPVPDTGSVISGIAIALGLGMIGYAGYVVYKKERTIKK